MTPAALARRLRRRLGRGVARNDFISLYNALMSAAADDPGAVAAQAEAICGLLAKQRRPREVVLFAELQARASVGALDLDGAVKALRILMSHQNSDAKLAALDVARAIWGNAEDFGSSDDHAPKVLAAVSGVLSHYGEKEELALVHLGAACVYSKHNATQAAYRSVADGEAIARELRSLSLLAKVFKTGVIVACEEQDFGWAADAADHYFEILEGSADAPEADLLSNVGVAYMNLDRLADAESAFRRALCELPSDSPFRTAVRTNLAACLRKAGDLAAAAAELSEARAEIQPDADPAAHLELDLVSARVEAAAGRTDELAGHLRAAAHQLERALSSVLRLHHRRGLRARYVPRIEGLLRELPDRGSAADVLAPLVATHSSGLADWLAALDWADDILRRPDLPAPVFGGSRLISSAITRSTTMPGNPRTAPPPGICCQSLYEGWVSTGRGPSNAPRWPALWKPAIAGSTTAIA